MSFGKRMMGWVDARFLLLRPMNIICQSTTHQKTLTFGISLVCYQ